MLSSSFPPSLDKLAVRCGTDKSHLTHNYAQFYDAAFSKLRDEPVKLLEIGVGRGFSLRMWKKYFRKGTIFAIESKASKRHYWFYGAKIFIGQQQDRAFLKEVMEKIGPMDIIIDDGSHHVGQQQITLGYLFPFVKPGGYYVIEDINSSYYNGETLYGVLPDESNSTVKMLENFQKSRTFVSSNIPKEELDYLNAHVNSCELYANGSPQEHQTSLLRKI
jgi:hypothetical protein